MAKEDYYSTLGIHRNAKAADVKKAYRRLARKHHPDVNPGDKAAEDRFKKIQEAYDVLSDSKKRSQYDQYGFYSENFQQPPGASARGEDAFRGFDFSNSDLGGGFREVFSEIFGGAGTRRRPPGPEKGESLEHHLNISFDESIRGLSTRLTINRHEACQVCQGLGFDRSKGQQVCPKCQGTGHEVRARGTVHLAGACRACGGSGQVGPQCKECGGSGRIPHEETITVRIPPGVDTGYRMRVPGKGGAGKLGAPSGELFLIISVRPHGFFRRAGSDIFCTVPVTVTEAALGTKIEVPTVEGKAMLRVPPATQSGQKFRLRGKGAPSLREEVRGDQIVEIRVVVPRVADERSKEILRELARLNPEDPRATLAQDTSR